MDKDQLSLAELSQLIKTTLDSRLEPSYWVVAEVGELRMNHSGHCYMELIDKKDEKLIAKVKATCWSYAYRTISVWFEQATGQSLAPGMKILTNVVVQYHELYGLSLNVRDIDPNYTLGERARRRQEIINRLINEGVYDMNRQLSLPAVPQRVAVISSPTAAGWGDFVNQLIPNPYNYRFEVKLFKAVMQGDGAEASIIQALEQIYAREDSFDLVVLIRGGGAQTDLDCFDNYNLAAHLAQFPLPILTGIGHERDETIADLVAHTKLKTPTAVAEFLLSGLRSFEETFTGLAEYIFSYTFDYLEEQGRQLEYYGKSIQTQSLFAFRQSRQKTELLSNSLQKGAYLLMKEKQKQLETVGLSWQRCLTAGIKNQKLRLSHLEKTVELLKPENTLKRGYSITYANGQLIKNATGLQEGDELRTRTSKGELISTVKNVNLNP
jgi:exodeoxyribonuclease VII large subunit